MDLATGIGLLAGVGVLIGIIVLDGGNFAAYWDTKAALLVFGGTTAATMIRFPFSSMVHGLPVGVRYAFQMKAESPRDLIEEITRVAEIVRQKGPIALENVDVPNPFLGQGLRFVADGYDRDFIRETLEKETEYFLERLGAGHRVYRAMGDAAPAWGMIGTVLGLVIMFSNMSDPSKLGPAMAIALLTTLYGALLGNLFFLPIADKLQLKISEEVVSRSLIIDGVLQIRDARSPTIVREMLNAYLPDHHREALADA
ncbi:MAG: flagellar motor protein PomA [Salinarimonadaceae bacterium]|nr:MAG: flagellar motor protein PomA [Salinarimonadaceae bacterium]